MDDAVRETVAAVNVASELFEIGGMDCGTSTVPGDVHVASVTVESLRFRPQALVAPLTRVMSAH